MPFPPSLETDFELVEQLPDCKILEAFRVRDRRRGRAEVILRLLPAEISQNPDIVSSFHSYFTRFSDIRNRMYIPAVYSVVGTVNRNVYVLEEYVSGISLSRFIEIRHTSPTLVRDVTEVLARACEALHHAHQKDIYHLCISPTDILFDEQNPLKVKLVGFGAQILVKGGHLESLSYQFRKHMAPEVLTRKEFKSTADIFSLASMIQEVFPGLDNLGDVLAKAMAVDPHERYQRPREFAGKLKEAGERSAVQPTGPQPSAVGAVGGLHPLLSITTEPLGSTVTVNGRVVGTTTGTVLMVPWKQGISIVVEKPGYDPETLDLIEPTHETNIHVTLKLMPLRFVTNPWGASVEVNGRLIGTTDRDGLSVPRDQGEIVIEKYGYKSKKLTFAVPPAEREVVIELELDEPSAPKDVPKKSSAIVQEKSEAPDSAPGKPKEVRIITHPSGAYVSIDGRNQSIAVSGGILVPWNQGEILIEKHGYKSKKLTFTAPPIGRVFDIYLKLDSVFIRHQTFVVVAAICAIGIIIPTAILTYNYYPTAILTYNYYWKNTCDKHALRDLWNLKVAMQKKIVDDMLSSTRVVTDDAALSKIVDDILADSTGKFGFPGPTVKCGVTLTNARGVVTAKASQGTNQGVKGWTLNVIEGGRDPVPVK